MHQQPTYAAGALRPQHNHYNGSGSAAAAVAAKTAPTTTNPPRNCSLASDRAALLSALVSATLARGPGAGAQNQQQQIDAYHARLLSFAARLLGSGVSSSAPAPSSAAPSSSSSSDAAAVVSSLKLRLLAQRRDRDAVALDERFARLCALHAAAGAGGRLAARAHGAALQLLAALSPGWASSAGGSSAVPAAQLPVGSLAAYQPLRLPDVQSLQQRQRPSMLQPLSGGGGVGGGSGVVMGGDFMGLTAASAQQQQQQQQQLVRAIQQQQQQQQQARPVTPPPPTAATTTTTTMSASRLPDALAREASIVRDVLRAAQHVDGAHVAFDLPPSSASAPPPLPARGGNNQNQNNIAGSADPALAALDRGVRVAPYKDTRLHPAQRALVHALGGELGLVVEAVRRHAGVVVGGGGGGGPSAEGGAVRLAFAGALSEELADYYRVLALLEAQARFRAPPPVPAAAAVPGAAAADEGGEEEGGNNSDGDDDTGFDYDDSEGASDYPTSTPYLTLRRLALWLSEPLRRLRSLAAAADACSGARGAALASRLWALSRTGDPAQRALLGRVLRLSCGPLFECTRRWVLEGALVDDAAEFFVVRGGGGRSGGGALSSSSSSAAPLDPWRECYRIEPSRVPAFVSSSLARRVLRAGKCLHFLREVCGDGEWSLEHGRAAALEAAAVEGAAGAADEDDDHEGDGGFARELAALERVVDAALRRVDARVMLLLRAPSAPSSSSSSAPSSPASVAGFDLPRHLAAARRYLLLGQGDFAAALLDAAAPELSKPAAQVSEVALEHALRQAVACSAARDDDPDTLDRLRARRGRGAGAAHGGGETGWDVFALQYEVSAVGGGAGGGGGSGRGGRGGGVGAPSTATTSPLASVFTSEAMASYRRVGRLMWRLRRAERALADVWRALKTEVERGARRLRPGSAARKGVESLLRESLSARNDAAALVGSVQHYASFEVIEVAWARLEGAAEGARDLDALVAAHAAFLTEVEQGALLQQQHSQVVGAVSADGDSSSPNTTPPLAALDALIDDALALHPLVSRLADAVGRAVSWLDQRSRRAAAATAAGGWGATAETGGVEDGGGALAPQELEGLARELAALREGREGRRRAFLAALRDADEAAGGGGQLGSLVEGLLLSAEGG
jgi:hypothetical protein